jgi:Tol biopolymer transport system component
MEPDAGWQPAHDLLLQLRWIAEGGDVQLAAARARAKRERRILAIVAAILFMLTVAAGEGVVYLGSADGSEAFQFRVPVAGLSSPDIAMSPDGKMLAVVAKPNSQEASSLYVRPTGATEFRRLVGTEEAAQPFWSPDSRSIGFTAGGRVKRVDASGGAPKDLGPAAGFTGGAWGTSNTILFGSPKGLYRVSAEGGTPEPVTAIDQQESGHFWPAFLPDGQHYLYLGWSTEASQRAIYTGNLTTKATATKVMSGDSNVVYAAPGYLFFNREATLFAQPFNAETLMPNGDALHVADQVEVNSTNGRGSFDVSNEGSVVYFQTAGGRGGAQGRGQMAGPTFQWGWRDRTGGQLELIGETGTFGDMDVSPDGKLVAVTQPEATSSGADIYVIDWQRNVSSRLTLDPADDINPVFSRPTGDRIAFTTFRKGNADIYYKTSNGNSAELPLLDTPESESIEAWSHDGRYIAYKQGPEGQEDIWILPLFGDKKPFPIVQGSFHKDEPQFSYDGKWLAYTSDESGGVYQVWVVSFPGREQRLQISVNGGGQPRWREDGKELFFRSPGDGSAFVADINLGPKLSAEIPRQLFSGGALTTAVSSSPVRHQWSVSPNGQRFAIRVNASTQGGGARGVTVRGIGPIYQPPTGQSAVVAGGQNFVSSGLTVIRNWLATSVKEVP